MREKIYQAIIQYIKKNGYSPSYREIGEIVGLRSTNTVYCHIHNLERDGKIEVNGFRAIKVIGYNFVKEGAAP